MLTVFLLCRTYEVPLVCVCLYLCVSVCMSMCVSLSYTGQTAEKIAELSYKKTHQYLKLIFSQILKSYFHDVMAAIL